MSYWLDSPWFEFEQEQDIFCPPKPSIPTVGSPQPLTQYERDFFFAGLMRQGLEGDHLHPPSAEVGNGRWCASTHTVCIHGVGRDSVASFLIM